MQVPNFDDNTSYEMIKRNMLDACVKGVYFIDDVKTMFYCREINTTRASYSLYYYASFEWGWWKFRREDSGNFAIKITQNTFKKYLKDILKSQ